MEVGILSYGIYIPFYRLKAESIAQIWGKQASDIQNSLGVREKSVAGLDEDSVTLAYEASIRALKNYHLPASSIEAIFVGSESHPYAVNPTSTILGEFLGVGHNYLATDLQFACKAATTAMISVAGLISAKIIKSGLIVGTDCAQAKPHDILEYTAASAAAAVILGKNSADSLAKIIDVASVSSDTPDFWRRDGVRFPSHGGRFTGEPAYFYHVELVSQNIFKKTGLKPRNFKYCVFHMPNGKFPRIVAGRLGFTPAQLAPSLIIDHIGNPYSASSLLGLSKVLDIANKDDLILLVSYGSGAGSDAVVLKVLRRNDHSKKEKFIDIVNRKKYINYVEYLKFGQKI
ncbi:hypothetical protein A2W14_05550 [Candidatus Gottesmanbacteria bacterium RBG_16_37_8]|uniref:Beta-ketoacyl-[acyl-carrier-protein] synthase III C-terminal domain-containing protein n=1 Tax=Candidatus Gottesmanbacteria bacterium RBG_16_37_8 TaxID=1798371 RepID=A0A1F5YUW1_9BACT|nr:MAG: hypothetical protein A2W14_05550 [Candidatus Gottesmanbacteria bacterium RBG_16_37_8]